MNLDDYGQEQLDRRIEVGKQCIDAAGGPDGDDLETPASDAISDILTAVYGPRGYYRYSNDTVSEFVGGDGIVEQAQALLDRSLRSWEGDAEDYLTGGLFPAALAREIKTALEGDSNDAEHDALVAVAQEFGIEYDPDAAY